MMLFLALSSVLLAVSLGYPRGAPLKSCEDMYPWGHHASPQNDTPPFRIEVTNSCYKAGHMLEVTVSRDSETWNNMEMFFEGLFVQARPKSAADTYEATSFGMFESADPDLKTIDCFNQTKSALTQKMKAHYNTKQFKWTAPETASKDFVFQFTMVRKTKEFWLDVRSEEIKFDSKCKSETSAGNEVRVSSLALLALVALATVISRK